MVGELQCGMRNEGARAGRRGFLGDLFGDGESRGLRGCHGWLLTSRNGVGGANVRRVSRGFVGSREFGLFEDELGGLHGEVGGIVVEGEESADFAAEVGAVSVGRLNPATDRQVVPAG